MHRTVKSLFVGAALAALIVSAPPARAITVFDPTNLAQNVLQASRALEQIHNQIEQIDQAAAMLRQNPLQLSPELSASIAEAHALFEQAQGIAFELNEVGDNLRSLYPQTWDQMNLGDILAQSDRWMAEDRQSVERAMEAQARAARSIAQSRGLIDRALQSSAGSEGQTGAIQAGNQLLGVTASQLAEIHALLVAQGRALETERMERIARQERAREIQRRAFPAETNAQVNPARSAFER